MEKTINGINRQTLETTWSFSRSFMKFTTVNKWRWFLFAFLLFLWFGNISVVFGETGKIRILFSAVLFFLLIPRRYSKGINSVLKSKQTMLAVLLLFLMSFTWFLFGRRDWNVMRDCIPLFGILLFTTMLIRTVRELRFFETTLLIVILVLGAVGIVQYVMSGELVARMVHLGGRKNPCDIAYVFCWAAPLAVSCFVRSRRIFEKMLASMTVMIGAIVVVGSGSRAGFLIFCIMMLISLSLHIRRRLLTNGFLILTVLLTIIFSMKQFSILELPFERIVSVFSVDVLDLGSVSSMDVRLPSQMAAFRMWLANPIFGIGYSNFLYDYGGLYRAAAHNTYLQLLAELGLVGFAVYVALLVSIYRGFATHWSKSFGLVPIALGFIALVTNTGAGLHILYVFAALSSATTRMSIRSQRRQASRGR